MRLVLAIGFALYLIGAHAARLAALYPARLAPSAVLAYIAYSVILLVLTRTKQEVGPALRLSAHAVDTLWAVFIFWSAASPVNGLSQEEVFFIFVIFVLLAAAYRWGLRGTLATSGVWIVFLVVWGLERTWPVPPEQSSRLVMQMLSLL
ncbi:MAG TPA: hypothetical protein VEO53_14630, partial [Candidatus Binatia bacterium]|nr:hypothetical protein [Candidatus Binatia bacterium]